MSMKQATVVPTMGAKASGVLTVHFTCSDMKEVMDALEVWTLAPDGCHPWV